MPIDRSYFDPKEFGNERFIGRIIEMKMQPLDVTFTDDNGQQVSRHYDEALRIEVENLSRKMGFNFSKNLVPSKRKQSMWVRMIEAFNEVGVNLTGDNLKDMVGRTFWFNETEIEMFNKRKIRFFYPVAVATAQELAALASDKEDETEEAESPDEGAMSQADVDDVIVSFATGVTWKELIEGLRANFPDVAAKVEPSTAVRLVKAGRLAFRNGVYEAIQ